MVRPIVLLVSEHHTSRCVYHAIRNLGVTHVIQEDGPIEYRPASLKQWLTHLFIRFATPLMKWTSRKRIHELKQRYPLVEDPIPPHHVIHVTSLNDEKTEMWLDRLAPQLVVTHETGRIADEVWTRLACPIITVRPSMAEGQVQAYWAVQGRPSLNEVTIERWTPRGWTVLDQAILYKGGDDNFATYPYLQLTTLLPMLRRHIESSLTTTESPDRRKA